MIIRFRGTYLTSLLGGFLWSGSVIVASPYDGTDDDLMTAEEGLP